MEADLASSNVKQISDLPGPKWALPFIGHAWQFKPSQFHLQLEDWSDQYGPFYHAQFGREPYVITDDLDTILTCMKNRPDGFKRGSRMREVVNEIVGVGVFTAEGDNWKQQRALVAETLKPVHIKAFMPTLTCICDQFLDAICERTKQNEWFDPLPEFQKFTIEVTTQFSFGVSADCFSNQENPLQDAIAEMFPMVSYRMGQPFPYWRYIKFKKDRSLDQAINYVRERMHRIIASATSRLATTTQTAEEATTFLDKLLVLGRENQQGFSPETIMANIFTMLLAGEDTTANTLAWLAYYLARRPEIQAQARIEIQTALNQNTDLTHLSGLDTLKYLDAITHETLRIRSAAPFMAAQPTSDMVIKGIHIPAGYSIMLLTRKAGIENQHFKDAFEFKPERWLKDSEITPHEKKSFLPFGAGPRFCPGRYLSIVETKLLFSKLLTRFEIVLDNSKEVAENFQFTMSPEHLRIRLKPLKVCCTDP